MEKTTTFVPLDSRTEYYAEWAFRMTTLLKAKGCYHTLGQDPPVTNNSNNSEPGTINITRTNYKPS